METPTCPIVLGVGQSWIASILELSTSIPLEETTKPKKTNLSLAKEDFRRFAKSCSSRRIDNTCFNLIKWCHQVKKTTHFSIRGLNTWFINLRKVEGALDSPNDMTNHSYRPTLVLKAVFYSSPGDMQIWWYQLRRSIFENIVEQLSLSNMSSSREIGWR